MSVTAQEFDDAFEALKRSLPKFRVIKGSQLLEEGIHPVIVIEWPDASDEEKVAQSVASALVGATKLVHTKCLMSLHQLDGEDGEQDNKLIVKFQSKDGDTHETEQ